MSNEAKQAVLDGLERRKDFRREKEEQLDRYEQEQLMAVSQNKARAEQTQQTREELIRLKRERNEAVRLKIQRSEKAMDILRRYIVLCMALMLVTCWTPLPWWATAALIVPGTVFPMIDIYRLWFPLEG